MKSVFTFAMLTLSTVLMAQADLNRGLVACYPFSGNAADLSGHGNHGTVQGALLTSDRMGNANSAYLFNGTSDYIDVNNPVIASKEFSISFWSKTLSFSSQIAFMLVPDKPSDRFAVSVNYNHRGDTAVFWDFGDIYGPGRTYNFNYNPNFSTWEHYTFITSRTADSMRVYRDGQLIIQVKTSDVVDDTSRILRIGSGDNWNFFHGAIDDIRIYNRALSTQEVAALYNSTTLCGAEQTTAIQEASNTPASIYPNPFSDRAVLSLDGDASATYNLRLFDITGKLVKEIQTMKGATEIVLEKGELGKGFYIYELSKGNRLNATGKLLIN